jgi:hypothetical protein
MSLQPAERAALTLRLCAARYLDLDCCPPEDPAALNLISAAYGGLEGAATATKLFVTSGNDLAPYLLAQADRLTALPPGGAGVTAVSMVLEAAGCLRAIAEDVRPDGSDDGPAIADEVCSCGVLNLAAEIETRVRRLLEFDTLLPFGLDPVIAYETALNTAESDPDFPPFCIDSWASIRRSPRTVTMVLRPKPINSRDLWHIAYALHHELICHAFQGAFATGHLPDAHPNCHWSEGWMDTLTFDLVREWEDAPKSWLPLTGEAAIGELRRFHDHRYGAPARLSPDDVKRRRLARDAYRQLTKTLIAHKMAISEKEADDIVRRFSLAANAHRGASCDRLKMLATKLRILLLNVARPEAPVTAASACLAFAADRDLEKLEQAITAASS